jgi:hypothetical protein
VVTAAVLVSAGAQARHRQKPYGLAIHELQPYRMGMLLPDLVLAVALSIQEFGLKDVGGGHRQLMLDADTVWRIPPAMNVSAVPPPQRKIRGEDIKILNDRRAGNRGRANRRKNYSNFYLNFPQSLRHLDAVSPPTGRPNAVLRISSVIASPSVSSQQPKSVTPVTASADPGAQACLCGTCDHRSARLRFWRAT